MFFWVMDATMINTYVLHQWCHSRLHANKQYKLQFCDFILRVSQQFAPQFNTVVATIRRRYTTERKRRADGTPDFQGPHGEDKRAHHSTRCLGGELERTPIKTSGSRAGRRFTPRCRYCWNANSAKKTKRTTAYQCSVCKTPLCVTCSYKYHIWVNF